MPHFPQDILGFSKFFVLDQKLTSIHQVQFLCLYNFFEMTPNIAQFLVQAKIFQLAQNILGPIEDR